jgi:hypothetical protein
MILQIQLLLLVEDMKGLEPLGFGARATCDAGGRDRRRASPMSSSMIWIGMDVHKDTVMVAVFQGHAREAEVVQQLPNDLRKLRGNPHLL